MISIRKIELGELSGFLNSLDLISTSSEWADFVFKQFGAEKNFFGVFEDEKLRFIIPTFKIGLIIEAVPKLYTEVIRFGEHKLEIPFRELVSFFKDLKGVDAIKLSFCFLLEPAGELDSFKKAGVAHILKTNNEDEEKILAEVVNRKTRNQIKTAYQRGGFLLEISAEIEPFYEIYKNNMIRLGSPPKNISYFKNLADSFGDNCKILFARSGNEIAGANFVLMKNRYLHLMFNVSKADFFKDYINDFLYWETIKYGLKKGIEIFDFGPATLNDKSHHHFKEGFGAKSVPIYRFSHYNSLSQRLNDFISTKTRNLAIRIRRLI